MCSRLILVIPAFTFSLGCWQVQRWYWKVQLIDELKKQIALNVVQFPFEDLSKLETMEFNKVELEGEFIHEREFLIFPRGRFDPEFQKNDRGGGLIASNTSSSSGAHIIAPFKIKGTDLIVMVNRGWVPQTHMAKSARKGTFPTGPQRLTAIIRKSEGRPQFVSENNIAKGIWFYKNFKQMGEYCGSAPIFLDATTEHSYFPNGPIAGQTNVEIRNKHVEYLATWYSLTALTLIMWYARFIK
uniref:SURF1-like protein n=1 Tax=Rhabditophanes sp. KR3021 TaxID=114890 RepID=A0AC35TNZ6_9BILA